MVSIDISNELAQILDSLPEEIREVFKFSKPKFANISACYDHNESTDLRSKEFKESIPNQVLNLPVSYYLFLLSEGKPLDVREKAMRTLESLNSRLNRCLHPLSVDDLFYLVRIWAFLSGTRDGVNQFHKICCSKELENVLMSNPLSKINIYQGIIFHFRADDDRFDVERGLCIRRLYPWEYVELIVEYLKMNRTFKIPALETLAMANFILEANSDALRGNDYWEQIDDLKGIVDVISFASKGNVWAPLFMVGTKGSTRWDEGIRGSDFSGRIGIVPKEQTSVFINRVRKGLDVRYDTVFKSIGQSLRQEEEDYGFEFRLVKLFHSLEKLLGSSGTKCGMMLTWLLEKEPKQRKEVFTEFNSIKALRNKIIHKVLLYDLMSLRDRSETLNAIDKLQNWLFNTFVDFLDSEFSLSDWQKDIEARLFGD